jgi:hypothetical protein
MSRLSVTAAAVFAVVLLFTPARAVGEPADPSEGALLIGFGGKYKVGHWTPVELRLPPDATTNGELAVSVVDGDGALMANATEAPALAADGRGTVKALIKPGRSKASIKLTDDSKNGTEARVVAQYEAPQALLATQELFVEVGRPIGLSLVPTFFADSLERPAAALVKDPQSLPNNWQGYEGVDVVAIATSDPAINRSWTEDAVGAVRQWVRAGGRLILCVGREGPRVLTEDSPLMDLAPGRFARVIDGEPGSWESFAGALTQAMKGADEGPLEPISTTVLTELRGRVDLSDRTGPLVIRAPYGFGEVIFVAADLDQPPFVNWQARGKLLLRLLNRADPRAEGAAARPTDVQGVRLGYTDLAGQLRAALGQFTDGAMVPFWAVFFLALGYAAAMFPLEFAIARWIRPRFEAAWIMLPLVLAIGVGGVWFLAKNWKGDRVLMRKLEVVDADVSTGAVRGLTWFSVYSPQTDAYDLRLTASEAVDGPVTDMRLTWLGLPGTGLGGMNSEIAGGSPFDHSYRQDGGSLGHVPLAAWSSKAFEGRWLGQAMVQGAQLAERDTDRQPRGLLRNETGLALRNCVLFYEGWTYRLGTIEAGASVEVGRVQRGLTVKSYLTGRRGTGEKEHATPYEPDSDDVARVAPMMMFHDAAEGRQYTSLSNRYFHSLDLTEQLRLERAVLFGAGPPRVRVEIDNQRASTVQTEEELTYYRFVIPVARSADSEERPAVELRLN